MPKFNIDVVVDGIWFDYDDGKIQIRPLTSEKFREIDDQVTKKEVEYKRVEGKAERFEVINTDRDQYSELFWDYVIQDWKNFFDAKMNILECTIENKLKLLALVPGFVEFIDKCMKQITEKEKERQQSIEKN